MRREKACSLEYARMSGRGWVDHHRIVARRRNVQRAHAPLSQATTKSLSLLTALRPTGRSVLYSTLSILSDRRRSSQAATVRSTLRSGRVKIAPRIIWLAVLNNGQFLVSPSSKAQTRGMTRKGNGFSLPIS